MGCQQRSHGNRDNHPVLICQHSVGIKLPCSDSLKKRRLYKEQKVGKTPLQGSVQRRGAPELGLGRDYLLEKAAGSPRRKHSE